MSVHDFSHHGDEDEEGGPGHRRRVTFRLVVATVIVVVGLLITTIVMVPADEAVVISRLGSPVRVITKPGLAFKLPLPLEAAIPIDLRLHTTSTGLQDVGEKGGLRVLMQTYTAWRVANDPRSIRQFLQALRNQPDEAAIQLRSYVNSAMQLTSSNFALADLVNSDPSAVKISAFEDQVRAQVERQMLQSYGIQVSQVGLERLTLPAGTLTATVARMSQEREIVAAERTATGAQQAAQITADAERNARETVANARRQAAQTLAGGEVAAARVYAGAYNANPSLYTTLRSLDASSKVVGPNTTIILRTDSPPFRVLSDGPGGAAGR